MGVMRRRDPFPDEIVRNLQAELTRLKLGRRRGITLALYTADIFNMIRWHRTS